jgi:hypothetical protein
VSFKRGDATNQPFDDKKYDVDDNSRCDEYATKNKMYMEARRVVKPAAFSPSMMYYKEKAAKSSIRCSHAGAPAICGAFCAAPDLLSRGPRRWI